MKTRNRVSFDRARRDRRGEAGQALVELAISLPLLSLLLLGAAELGRVAYASIEVANAARSAAQYGAWSHAAVVDWTKSGSSYVGGIPNAATADSDLSGLNAIRVKSVSVSCTCADTSYTPTSCSDNTTCMNHNTAMLQTLTVQTEGSFTPLIHYPGGQTTFTLHGSASQVVTNR